MTSLRAAALIAVLVGSVGSVGFMLRAGQRNESRLLLFVFAVWVLSPFVALVVADGASKRWSVLTRATLYGVMLILAPLSLVIYGNGALRPAGTKNAFVYVMLPPVSWLLAAIIVSTAAFISRRRQRTLP
jgi:hypothetical protein